MLKLDPKNTELLKQKQDILNSSIATTEEKLKQLKEIKDEADKKMAEGTKINEENYRALQREIINTQNKLNTLKTEASSWNKAGKKLEEYGQKLEDLGTKADKVANKMTVGLTVPIVAGYTAMTKSAIENETAVQQVERIYGEAAESIKEFAESKALDYNMSASDAYKYSQIYGNLIQSITDDQQENAEQTQKLLQASSVIASATGRSMEDVMDRIRSGLLGNTEAIEDLGVNVNVALLETTDAFKQIAGDKSWDKLTFQEQQQIRLLGILEQTSKKYGDEVQDNTASSIQKLTAKTKNLTNDLGKKLLPIANKVLDKANDLVDSFNNLSDEQKDNIVNIGLMVAAAGPLLKVGSTAISTVGKVTKGLGTMTEAIGVFRGEMTSSNTTVNSTAKVIGLLANPTGVAIASIGALAGAYTWLKNESEKIPEELQKTIDKMEETKNAHEEYRAELDKTASTSLSEIENTENLRNELTKLVDENGKVKEGYKDRVSVILNELNKALGTEYSLTGDIINQYQTLQEEIDLLILKKKAQIVLENEESKYATAIQNKTSAYQTMINAQNEYNKALEGKTYEQYFNDLQQQYIDAGYTVEKSAEHAREHMAKWVDGYKNTYESSVKIYNDYLTDIAKYENDYAIMQSDNTEKIKQMIDERINNYGRENLSRGEQIKEGIQQEIYNINELKKLYQEDLNNQNEISAQANASAIQSSKQRLQTLLEGLIAQTSIINENSPEVIEAWKQLATGSYSTYYDTVSNLEEEQSKIIQEMTGVTIERTPELVEETKNMAESVLNEFKQNEKFRETAINNLEGLLQGLEDEELRQLLKDSGIENVEEVIKGIQEGNLAEDEGEKILENLNAGLSNTAWQNTLWAKARGIASTLSGLLTVKANVNGSTSNLPGHKSGLDYVPYDNYIARLHKGERVLTAEENKQLMQMEKASRLKVPNMKAIGQSVADSIKTVFTTPTIVINAQDELTPHKINTIIDTVNRRLGSKY